MANNTIQSALAEAICILEDDSAKLDAEILLAHVLQKSRSYLFAWSESAITAQDQSLFNNAIARRHQGEPIAYIVGMQEFWSLPFKVTHDTLIPRPDTEILVQSSLEIGRKIFETTNTPLRLIDLGTGSGCIALAIAHEEKNWQLIACDISEPALDIARKNAANFQINNVQFLQSDWFSAVPAGSFDLIISNPPYIAANDVHLTHLKFEPKNALSSGADGLDAIAIIGKSAFSRLNPQGVLLIEIGFDQSKAVENLLMQQGYQSIEFKKDLSGHSRVCIARLAQS